MSTAELFENAKIAIALRSARTALGWNQQEFSEKMGVAKSTVARIETMEMAAKGEFVLKAMRIFREAGIEIDLYDPERLTVVANQKAIAQAIANLQDESQRRADRRVGLRALLPPEE